MYNVRITSFADSPTFIVQDPFPTSGYKNVWDIAGGATEYWSFTDEVWLRVHEQLDRFTILGHGTYYVTVDSTVRDLDLYVDTYGSDSLGDGTETNPYATVRRAWMDVPKNIQHTVRIYAAAGDYDNVLPTDMEINVIGDGTFLLAGKAEPTEYLPETITTNVARTTGGSCWVFTVAGAAWDVDDFVGKYVQIIGGDNDGYTFTVGANTADTIHVPDSFDTHPITGDHFRIIEPSVIFNNVPRVTFKVAQTNTSYMAGWESSRVVFANFIIRANVTDYTVNPVVLQGISDYNSCHILSAVTVTSAGTAGVTLSNAAVNYNAIVDVAGCAAACPSISNLSAGWAGPGFAVTNDARNRNCESIAANGTSTLASAAAIGMIVFYGGQGWMGILCACAVGFSAYVGSVTSVLAVGTRGVPSYNYGGVYLYHGQLVVSNLDVLEAPAAFFVGVNGRLRADTSCACSSVNVDYGAIVHAQTSLSIGAAQDACVGSLGAIKFTGPDPDQVEATWPTAGHTLTDSMGAFVTYG